MVIFLYSGLCVLIGWKSGGGFLPKLLILFPCVVATCTWVTSYTKEDDEESEVDSDTLENE
ncbi:hypothetical protein AGMMS50239_14390 [Bacteroidia bacterium]|nr:hypothetical protein AGMMS50239_14390 [Bacteroidia bacterium]